VISVLSNLMPDRIKAMADAALAGQFDTARSMHLDLFELCDVMFIETNPIPIKTAMAMAGLDTGELRLPLCEMAAANRALLEQALAEHGLVAGKV
jgi:4-hydroxy-tetrahydrodipicolinate synthase